MEGTQQGMKQALEYAFTTLFIFSFFLAPDAERFAACKFKDVMRKL